MLTTLKQKKLLLVACFLLGFFNLSWSQGKESFSFSSPDNWTQEDDHYVITGRHKLNTQSHVWMLLRDHTGNHFLQSPPVSLDEDHSWKATNIRPSSHINYTLMAIKVNKKGHEYLWNQVERGDFSGKKENWLNNIPGKKVINKIDHSFETSPGVVITDGGTIKKIVTPPDPTLDSIVIATFERGSNPITLGGNLSKWQHTNEIEVEVDYHRLEGIDPNRGRFCASASFQKMKSSQEWSGGGPVLTFYANEAGLDLSKYQYLVFEVMASKGSQLDHMKIKLEDEYGGNRPERPLKDFGYFLSDGPKWQRVKIPLTAFTSTKGEREPLNVKKVSKLVFVITDAQPVKGTFYFDNVRFK